MHFSAHTRIPFPFRLRLTLHDVMTKVYIASIADWEPEPEVRTSLTYPPTGSALTSTGNRSTNDLWQRSTGRAKHESRGIVRKQTAYVSTHPPKSLHTDTQFPGFLAARLLLCRHVSLIDPSSSSLQLDYSDSGKPHLASHLLDNIDASHPSPRLNPSGQTTASNSTSPMTMTWSCLPLNVFP